MCQPHYERVALLWPYLLTALTPDDDRHLPYQSPTWRMVSYIVLALASSSLGLTPQLADITSNAVGLSSPACQFSLFQAFRFVSNRRLAGASG